MHDAFLIFYFNDRKTAMHNLFISRTVQNTHKNNTINKGPIIFGIYFANKPKEQPRISDLPQLKLMFSHAQVKKTLD